MYIYTVGVNVMETVGDVAPLVVSIVQTTNKSMHFHLREHMEITAN